MNIEEAVYGLQSYSLIQAIFPSISFQLATATTTGNYNNYCN